MRIAVAQIDTILGEVRKNFSKIEHYVDKAKEEKCDLIVFPELALSGYGLRDLVYTASVGIEDEIFVELKQKSVFIDIAFGFALKENGYFFNSAVYMSDGEIVSVHKKKFLPDYGMFEEGRYFAAGKDIRSFDTKFGRTTMLICEDAFHIVSHFEAFKTGTSLLIVLSASPFWSDAYSMKWEMWENTCKTSAQLNGYFVVFANRVGFEDGVGFFGKSFVVDPFGNILKEAALFKEDLLIVDVDIRDVERARIKMPIMKNEDIQ